MPQIALEHPDDPKPTRPREISKREAELLSKQRLAPAREILPEKVRTLSTPEERAHWRRRVILRGKERARQLGISVIDLMRRVDFDFRDCAMPLKPASPSLNTGHTLYSGVQCFHLLNEGAGTSIGDITGNGHVGTATAASWGSDGEIGPFWQNSGTGSPHISFGDLIENIGLTSTFSFAVLIKGPTPGSAAARGFLGVIDLAVYSEGYHAAGDGSVQVIGTDFSPFVLSGSITLLDGDWHWLWITSDGTTLRFNLDGAPAASSESWGTSILDSGGDFLLGQHSGYAYYDDLKLGAFGVWNREVTASEISAHESDPWGLVTAAAGDVDMAGDGTLPTAEGEAPATVTQTASGNCVPGHFFPCLVPGVGLIGPTARRAGEVGSASAAPNLAPTRPALHEGRAVMNRSVRWLPDFEFELWGGRRPRPGYYRGVPLRAVIPGWLTEVAIEFLRQRGVVPMRVRRDHDSVQLPGEMSHAAVDAFDFDYAESQVRLRRTLRRLFRHARWLC